MRILPAGDAALLVEADDVGRLYAALREAALPGVLDLVPAMRTVLVTIDRARTDLTSLTAAVDTLPLPAAEVTDAARLIEIPTTYDGPDLAEVAELTGLSTDEVVRRHQASEWTVAFCGFAPGFGYLVGGDLRVPRRTTPRTAVPAGAVALADEFSAVYPRRSPGGWQLIGHTDAVLWDTDRDPPALLPPRTRVRFVPA